MLLCMNANQKVVDLPTTILAFLFAPLMLAKLHKHSPLLTMFSVTGTVYHLPGNTQYLSLLSVMLCWGYEACMVDFWGGRNTSSQHRSRRDGSLGLNTALDLTCIAGFILEWNV